MNYIYIQKTIYTARPGSQDLTDIIAYHLARPDIVQGDGHWQQCGRKWHWPRLQLLESWDETAAMWVCLKIGRTLKNYNKITIS